MENRKQKNFPLATEKCPICQFVNVCTLAHRTFFSGEWDIFFYIFWFNLLNIPIFPIYYTNIHNLSEKELKTPENPIFKTQIETQTQF